MFYIFGYVGKLKEIMAFPLSSEIICYPKNYEIICPFNVFHIIQHMM